MQTDEPQIRPTAIARIAPYLLAAAGLAVLLVFVLLAQYAHPSSDDFCMASGVYRDGLITHLWNHYLQWSGRYTSNALYALYPVLFDLFDAYKFIPPIIIAGLFLATAYLLSAVFAIRLLSGPVLLVSLCFVSVYLLGMLSPASSLYWMAGAFTYQSANVFILFILGLMIHLADRQRESENYAVVLTMLLLLMLIAMGANETAMLALSALTLTAVVLRARLGWQQLWPWLLVLVVALMCFTVVYLSPGNEVRGADFPLRYDWSRSIAGSVSVGTRMLWTWFSSPVLILASLLAPFAVMRLVRSSGRRFDVTLPLIAALVLCTFTLPIVLQFPAWWAMGGWPPLRTFDGVYFLFLLCWFATIAAITIRYYTAAPGPREKKRNLYAEIAVLLLTVLFSAFVVQHETFRQAKQDLLHLARPYHDYLNARYQRIQQAVASGQRYLVVADFEQQYPRSLYYNDIMRDPEHWRNECYADFFGLHKIRREKSRNERERAPSPQSRDPL